MKHLLVGYDFTPEAARALLRAVRLAARDGAALRVVHVVPNGHPSVKSSMQSRLLAEVGTMAEELDAAHVKIAVCTRSGSAADMLLEEAEDVDADLIVLGGHGNPRFRDALFGTTATHIARHCDRAVLIVQDGDIGAYSKVMVAIDDPGASQPLLTTTFAVAPRAEAYAVHAFYPTLKQSVAGASAIEREQVPVEKSIEKALAKAGRTQGSQVKVHAMVETGDVLSVMMKSYEELEPDLLAIGTRAGATYLGSHAVDTIFWCPHDLLVVPERAMSLMQPSARNEPLAAN
jgi:nucleotide-binding universal stress UspA family protein